jgi:hypothetical protein
MSDEENIDEPKFQAVSKDPDITDKDQFISKDDETKEDFKDRVSQEDDITDYVLDRYKRT